MSHRRRRQLRGIGFGFQVCVEIGLGLCGRPDALEQTVAFSQRMMRSTISFRLTAVLHRDRSRAMEDVFQVVADHQHGQILFAQPFDDRQ